MFRGSYIFCMVLISVMVLGLLFGSFRTDENERVRKALFPELKSNRTDVSRIQIFASDAGAGAKVTLISEGGQWRVQERLNHVADLAKINRFVKALVEADKLERKTFTQENFYRVGVDDSAIGVSLGEQTILWVGDTAKNQPGRYVRMLEADESEVWLISAALKDLSTNPADWLDSSHE